MTAESNEKQLELFHLTNQSAPRPHREALGRLWLPLRYDQLILASIAGLIGLTVIFATGVERGKELVRGERGILSREQTPAPVPAARSGTVEVVAGPKPAAPAESGKPKATTAIPAAAPRPKARIKVAAEAGASRYAVQLAAYSQLRLARQELDRLRARGEQAFLVMRNGRTFVYVGPFPSRNHASERLTVLKPQYQDCFVRTL